MICAPYWFQKLSRYVTLTYEPILIMCPVGSNRTLSVPLGSSVRKCPLNIIGVMVGDPIRLGQVSPDEPYVKTEFPAG